MRQSPLVWKVFAVLLMSHANTSITVAGPDAHVLNDLFGDEQLGANVDVVRKHAASLSSHERYEFLADWVLPSESHATIRLTANFSPYVSQTNTHDFNSTGTIVSPAIDLIVTAESMGMLDELYRRVREVKPQGEHQERCQLALAGMIQIRRGETIDAEKFLNELESRRVQKMARNLFGRWPETLLLSFAARSPALREVAAEYLQRILEQQVRVAENSIGHDEWDRCIQALWGQTRLRDEDVSGSQLENWHPVSECDEKTRGVGFPESRWQRTDRQVECLARHQNDYLLYRIPLQGNYEVECDITGFGYREGQLVIGGHWISPHYHRNSFEVGNLRGVVKNPVPVDPKLSLVNDWIHYRAVVRDGVCRLFMNGRELVSEPLHEHQFPWIALRTMFFSNASIRDVRITGSPTAPKEIEMTTDPNLSGWMRFHRDNVGGPESDWRFEKTFGPNGGLYARRKEEFAGTYHESLLRYFRPMLEDGTIEYEFYYQPGEFEVFPALDQQAFLLAPDGVRVHEITNGIWERTGLDPQNARVISSSKVPLTEGWNKLRFELIDDRVTIFVNETEVHAGDISEHNDRTFGLFHYADQSKVQVRNMTWRGNWPTRIPELARQELYGTHLDEINSRSAELPIEYHFDFSKPADNEFDTEPLVFQNHVFLLNNTDMAGKVMKTENGLHMQRPPARSFKDVWIAPHIRVAGDFDVIAEFENLSFGEPTNGSAALYLTVVTEDDLTTHSRVWHGVYAHPGIDRRRVTQAELDYFRPGQDVEIQFEGVTAEASSAGRMRITRIGKTYSFLIAEGDSHNYRLIHQQKVNDKQTAFNGIRIGIGTYDEKPPKQGLQVLWKKLHIHAEALAE